MKIWLVLDVHYLCHRSFHTTKDLSFKNKATGVIYGFLNTLGSMIQEFQTNHVAFCFEHKRLYRRDIYPSYKMKRHKKELTIEEKEAYTALAIQISELQHRYLPKIGFKNIFSFRGMESDDIMAQIAANQPEEDEVILVTSDNDLLQCLAPNVMMYSPQKRIRMTQRWFEKKYGIPAWKWAIVKAIAGCSSDEVQGIKGVGELTALKYLRGELPPKSKAYQSIVSGEGVAIVQRNRPVVELPYTGCPVPDLVDDRIDQAGWREVCRTLGMRSIMARPPIVREHGEG